MQIKETCRPAGRKLLNLIPVVISFSIILLSTGCGEITYPKEKLGESLIKLCKDEYHIDVDASIIGKTLAIYLPLDNLFDVTLNISEPAWDKVSDVLLNARRISLSTDADIKFYCVIAQDVRLPEIQLVIVNYVEDAKRVLFSDISRGEYFKRTLVDINENPQAKKEQAIVDVFGKMKLEKEWQDKILEDFFRSPPSSLEGIGYWQKKFYIKDITLEEFLAQQIARRIKMRFREEEDLEKYALKSVNGKFEIRDGLKVFFISFNAESILFIVDPDRMLVAEREIFTNAFEEASDVIYGYKFKNFDLAELAEKSTNKKLLVSKENLYLFKKRKLGIDGILGGIK
ncbi:MAG: hypothetical protein JSV93_03985 [Candidatus Omnitrophota bacterium]|nr:MAG: hypothetical protein JSV93_03985 [Candidatus Omnitrophota bacterium]